ncbi:ArsR/SmtB family transcription factor [Aureibacillus halotolerans]|uniref:ArsR family transcriptional regulator n=1 Tax=Aureibacillus halotolerans TaxID=1508390 RepID=A0A4R6U7Y6_9BACI|nr:winged helix-turn-helix domain-containing protein [Aureibacillus halotolerans]TDQ42660.1 ArsR family transcriptional regulator [Aureibacillus halotolerans]
MKPMFTVTTHAQLKSLADPLRAKLMMRLIEKPFTGQQLSEIFSLSRANIHYHLKELEKNHLIKIVRKEEKNGILQKFYQSVARGFTPSAELLPHVEEVSETARQMFFQMTERTKAVLLSAPEQAFELKEDSVDPKDWPYVGSTWQVSVTDAQFQAWVAKYHSMMEELRELSRSPKVASKEEKIYYISTMAFEVDDLVLQDIKDLNEE